MASQTDTSRSGSGILRASLPLFTFVLAASLLLVGLSLSSRGHETVRAEDEVLMAVDADPVQADIQNCVSVDTDDDVDVDFVIQNVPVNPGIQGFGLRLLYDNNIVSMQSKDRSDSILGTSGDDLGDPLPDTSNSYLDGYVVDEEEKASGSGILTRYTIHAEAAGLTRLHLMVGNVDTNYVDGDLLLQLPEWTLDAFISVGAPCPDDTTDRDSDGVKDLGADGELSADDDNCPSASNAGQEDRDSDTLGNACDPVVMTIDANTSERKTQTCRGNVTTDSAVDLLIRSADPEGFQLRLAYDNSVVSFADRSATWSVLGTSGLEYGGPPDDTSRMFHAYTGNDTAVVPNDGVLMRYTVNAVGSGLTRLHLINGPLDSAWVDSDLNFYVADQTPDAFLEVGGACPSPTDDRDSDGFTDYVDTCPNVSDPGQEDIDNDAIGDACDADAENDAVLDVDDNCPKTVNTNQADNDSDGQPGVQPGPSDTFGGDACDPDDDNDTVLDGADTAPLDEFVC